MISPVTTRNRLLSINVTDGPDADAVSLAEMKTYGRIKHDDDDALLTALIAAATRGVENAILRPLITQQVTVQWEASSFPLRLYRPKILSLVSVTTYYQGTATAEDVSAFYLIGENGLRPKIALKDDGELTGDPIEMIEIVTTNGFGPAAANIPAELTRAVKAFALQMYEHPDEYPDPSGAELPLDLRRDLGKWKPRVI